MLLDLSKKYFLLRNAATQKLSAVGIFAALLICSSWSIADGLFDFQMKLAKKGNAEAEFKVGEMYETGFGVNKDLTEAKVWIDKAAAQGHENAGFKLLYWDMQKNGLKGENKEKFTQLRTKANANNSQAMYYLGKMYAYGVGVKKNYDKSLDWLNKATFDGVLEAEREAVTVREMKQKSLTTSRRAEENRKLKAKEDAQRKEEEDAKKKAEADKLKQDSDKQKKANEQQALIDKKNREAELADKENKEAKKKTQLEEKQKQAKLAKQKQDALRKKQALLKSQAAKKKKADKESKFESDPCSGKSARFLSTCR